MHLPESIRAVDQIYRGPLVDLPEEPGVYAFWWIDDKAQLMASNRHIILKGPSERPVDVEYKDWWPFDLVYPCLYVGKSTNIKNRFSLHIKRGCPGRLHKIPDDRKVKPRTTSCQLRFGIEHVFRSHPDPLSIIFRSVGFSYRSDFPNDAITERFYMEDKLIGLWRPWFNVDSER